MDYLATNDISDIVENDRKNVWHHLIQHKPFETGEPRIIVEGKGNRVWDQHGKNHLDTVSGGIWTVNVGYGRERIANAVRDQLIKMNYFACTAGSVPGAIFADMLTDKMPGLTRVYYSNSGSEANEKVYKMVRQISAQVHGGKKWKILFRDRDYHGTTIANLGACGHAERMTHYGPFPDGFVKIPHCLEYRSEYGPGDYTQQSLDAIEAVIKAEGADTIGAMVLEPITAGGGVIVPPEGYLQGAEALCRKYKILLHIDEVVCGVGRTGTWFGYQHYGLKPDFVTMAKGVASGYAAIACTVTTEAVFDIFKDASDKMSYFRDVSTFGGCTAGPTAAIENMKIIEEESLLENTVSLGEYLMERLGELQDKHACIGQVRGKGLFCGLELVTDRASRDPVDEKMVQAVVGNCMAQGVIIGATNRSFPGFNNTLCFSPALISTRDDMDEMCGAVDKALGDVFSD